MKTKENRRFAPRAILLILASLLTLNASSGGCECKTTNNSSSSGGSSTPANPQITVTNNYGTAIGVEIWTGKNLEYKEGTVYGDSLSKVYPAGAISSLGNGSTANNVATITYNSSFIMVIGVQDGADYIYVTSRVVSAYLSSSTFTVSSSGTIN